MKPGHREYWQNGMSKSLKQVEPVRKHNTDLSVMDERFLFKALQIIENNINEASFNSAKLRNEIGISRSHLHRKLKTLTNKSTTGFIRTIRLKRAAELLYHRVASVSEIAYDTGFNNLSYFSSCFKQEFGVVPSAYFEMAKSIEAPSSL